MYFYRARYYDPVLKRFISSDPIGLAGGPNEYQYVGGSPNSHADPLGLFMTSVDAACAQDPLFCAELVGDMTRSAGAMSGNACLADRADNVADGISNIATLMGVGSLAKGAVGGFAGSAKKLQRFNGSKPTHHTNPAHVAGQPGFNPKKTPQPSDAESVYAKAVPNDPMNPTAWFGKNADGQIYRYSLGRNGTMHFSGIDGVGDGTRNLTKYAKERLWR